MTLKLTSAKMRDYQNIILYIYSSNKDYKPRSRSRCRHIHMVIKLDKPYQHYYSTETGSKQGEIVTEDICQKTTSSI